MEYEEPSVTDYGDLLELTAATSLFGDEDGASKLVVMHHTTVPTSP